MRSDRIAPLPWLVACLSFAALGGPRARGEAAPASTSNAPPRIASGAEKRPTCKVETGPIKVVTTLKGIVEAEQMAEVALRPEAWSNALTVEKAVDHGTVVKKGDVLVELDRAKIDQAIGDLRVERSLAELTLKHAEDELPVLERMLPLDLAAASRSKAEADEDLARFLKKDRPLSEENAQFQLRSARNWLEYAQDELAQLEKMYRDKDLTEETERLILKRYRFSAEMAKFQLRSTENTTEQTLKVDLPRREQSAKDSASKQALALEKAKNLLPLEVLQKRLARDKQRYDTEKTNEKLAKLERDRAAMTVRAPCDGIVYYGKPLRGQWTTAAATAPKLQRDGVLTAGETFVTVVNPRPAFVHATVDEKDLHLLRPSLEGKATPVGFPALKLPARLASISAVPQTPGQFEARVEIELGHGADAVMPGMACMVKLTSYRKKDALTVPASAVFSDEGDEDASYVYVASKTGEPERRSVTVGHTAAGRSEILDGLKAGDEILTAKP